MTAAENTISKVPGSTAHVTEGDEVGRENSKYMVDTLAFGF